MYVNDIKKREKAKVYTNTKELKEGRKSKEIKEGTNPPDTEGPGDAIVQTRDKVEGVSSGEMPEYPRLILEQHTFWDLDNDGIKEAVIITVDHETKTVLRITRRELPTGEEIRFFTQYSFIPNPDSLYGLGFGHLLEHISESASSIVNLLIDAGTLQNTPMGFVARGTGMKRGDQTFKMGEFKEVDFDGDDIRKAIIPFTFSPPSPTLMRMLEILKEYAEKITSVSEAMMGQLPASDTGTMATMAAIEQGQALFSASFSRLHTSFSSELRKIFFWNKMTISEQENIYILTQNKGSAEEAELTSGQATPEGDFNNAIDVVPVSNPIITSRAEKKASAQQAYEIFVNDPVASQNEDTRIKLLQEVFKAMEVPNAEKLLTPPPPPVPEDLPPQIENANFIKEISANVLKQQDHVGHMKDHQAFAEGRYGQDLTPQGKNLLEFHQREHAAAQYLKEVDEGKQIARDIVKNQPEPTMNELQGAAA
jgi:hypothetical protein